MEKWKLTSLTKRILFAAIPSVVSMLLCWLFFGEQPQTGSTLMIPTWILFGLTLLSQATNGAACFFTKGRGSFLLLAIMTPMICFLFFFLQNLFAAFVVACLLLIYAIRLMRSAMEISYIGMGFLAFQVIFAAYLVIILYDFALMH